MYFLFPLLVLWVPLNLTRETVEGKAMTSNKERIQTSESDSTVHAARLRSATAEDSQHKPARESVKSNVQKQKNYFLEEVWALFQEHTFKHSNTQTVKPENFRRIPNRGRLFIKVDNLWSKHTRNDAREANTCKWIAETHNMHSMVYGQCNNSEPMGESNVIV